MAYIKRKKIKGRIYHYLVESYRQAGKVKTRTLKYLGPEAAITSPQGDSSMPPPLTRVEKETIGALQDLFGGLIRFQGPTPRKPGVDKTVS